MESRTSPSRVDVPESLKSQPADIEKALSQLTGGADPRTRRVLRKAYEILARNRVAVRDSDNVVQVFTTPSLSSGAADSHLDYGGKQWLWDSCAHAMNLAFTEPDIAKGELRAMLANQSLSGDDRGFIPHMNYFFGDGRKVPEWAKKHFQSFLDSPEGCKVPVDRRHEFVNCYWSNPYHSDLTQPPILAMAVLEVVKATRDEKFAVETLPQLKAYYDYLQRRRADSDHLLRIIHPWESGWDNSQRWDRAIGLATSEGKVERWTIDVQKIRLISKYKALDWDLEKILSSRDFVVKPVDFNVLYAKNLECLAHLCRTAADKEAAETYTLRARDVGQAIFTDMWDGDKYVDIVQTAEGDTRSRVKSAAMFYPMMLGGEPHSERLIHRHLANPKEFSPANGYLVPTTSLDDPTHDGGEYWRGNIWGIVNFFVHCGLQEYLKSKPTDTVADSLARKIHDSMIELLDQADFYEYFHCHKIAGEPKGYGVHSFGWNGLVLFMDRRPAFLESTCT